MKRPDFKQIRDSRPLAARPSTCSVCGLPIAIGSRYQKIVYIDHTGLDTRRRLKVVRWHLPICPPGGAEHG